MKQITHTTTEPRLWTYKDAARYAGVTVKTVTNWITDRRISVIKLNRVCRIEPEKFKREMASFERKSLVS